MTNLVRGDPGPNAGYLFVDKTRAPGSRASWTGPGQTVPTPVSVLAAVGFDVSEVVRLRGGPRDTMEVERAHPADHGEPGRQNDGTPP